jgi:hypothetical protein
VKRMEKEKLIDQFGVILLELRASRDKLRRVEYLVDDLCHRLQAEEIINDDTFDAVIQTFESLLKELKLMKKRRDEFRDQNTA